MIRPTEAPHMFRRRFTAAAAVALACAAPTAAQAAPHAHEPVLLGRAIYSATQLQTGPVSGQVGVDPNNGQTPPFAGQPVPGISGALANPDGTFWGQPDNGFGAKDNSRDFLLRLYHMTPRWRGPFGGSGQLVLD